MERKQLQLLDSHWATLQFSGVRIAELYTCVKMKIFRAESIGLISRVVIESFSKRSFRILWGSLASRSNREGFRSRPTANLMFTLTGHLPPIYSFWTVLNRVMQL